MKNYIVVSLELHLFFARIMKEHSLFLEAGFQAKDSGWIKKASFFRIQFEDLLRDVTELSDGIVGKDVLESGEVSTVFTIPAEDKTSCLTGIPIDSKITEREQKLTPGCGGNFDRKMAGKVKSLNQKALRLVNGLIKFKEDILSDVSTCKLYTANYPLLIQHIIREAKLYRSFLQELEHRGIISQKCIVETELFWNRIMMEHALFIRGLLDPTEEELITAADGFAGDYRELLAQAGNQTCKTMDELSGKTLKETEKYRDFKAAGTKGINDCEISSLILPLLADHVLREANHYLRILRDICERN